MGWYILLIVLFIPVMSMILTSIGIIDISNGKNTAICQLNLFGGFICGIFFIIFSLKIWLDSGPEQTIQQIREDSYNEGFNKGLHANLDSFLIRRSYETFTNKKTP